MSEKETENIVIVQPEMRFKPRTDLERIVETINTRNFGSVGPSLLNKHLKELRIGIVKKTSTICDNSLMVDSFEIRRNKRKSLKEEAEVMKNGECIDQKSLFNKSIEIKTNQLNKHRLYTNRQKANSDAKYLMSDLHTKTHFKAASVFSVLGSNNQYK